LKKVKYSCCGSNISESGALTWSVESQSRMLL
jgi:hypothetical protein